MASVLLDRFTTAGRLELVEKRVLAVRERVSDVAEICGGGILVLSTDLPTSVSGSTTKRALHDRFTAAGW